MGITFVFAFRPFANLSEKVGIVKREYLTILVRDRIMSEMLK